MSYGESLLSKVIDSNDPSALTRFSIDEIHFPTKVERLAYRFIREYADTNRGQAPDYRTIVAEVDGFTYMPNVEDSYDYLTKQLKQRAAKRMLYEFLQSDEFTQVYNGTSDGIQIVETLKQKAEEIIVGSNVRSKVGTDIKTDTEKFLEEYRKRKEGTSFKIWRSNFPSLPNYISGNMYTWYGRSGRGKSVFTLEEAIEAAMQGANVLIWAMEMSRFEIMARAYSSISAREGIVRATIEGVDYEAGFENMALLTGKLSNEFEAGFETFLSTLSEIIPGSITIRAVDDEDFHRRDVRQLEADIIATNADVVVIDPIYYLDFESNTSKVAGGDVAATSKKLRHLAGRTQTVIHVITQAEEVKDDRDDDGNRELRVPKRAEIKKTKAVLEDATNTYGIDTLDGIGIIEQGKGRNGGEGERVEVIYLPNYGIVKELRHDLQSTKQFDF
jgi:hypothetical protein